MKAIASSLALRVIGSAVVGVLAACQSTPTTPGGDPQRGTFTLQQATRGLAGSGPLEAEIVTDAGTLRCTLFDDRAPNTVANFVGLARGLRPWLSADGRWARRPAYDGTSFHRVVKGFVIQGGDPLGTGEGEPGYVIPDEVWPGATHDRRGQLAMANRGPNTNGMQFFITDGPARHLDGGFTIFGQCGPDALIEKLASIEARAGTPVRATRILRVTVSRAAPAASR